MKDPDSEVIEWEICHDDIVTTICDEMCLEEHDVGKEWESIHYDLVSTMPANVASIRGIGLLNKCTMVIDCEIQSFCSN